MNVSGFTFIKNGLSLGYPFVEAIESISPLCSEVIINVGFDNEECTKDDGTYDYLINKYENQFKYKFIKSYWNPETQKKGLILSEQTNIALAQITGDLGIYIQGDECIHEKDLEIIKEGMTKLYNHKNADAIVLNYHHFYGNTDIIKVTKKTYRNEIRIIRNGKNIISWLDAQGFRYKNGEKIKSIKINAFIYHYGWARLEQVMIKKTQAFSKLYHGKDYETDAGAYSRIWGLRPFYGKHPIVMDNWISNNKNDVEILKLPMDLKWSDARLILSDYFEYLTGIRIGEYQNYKTVD